MTQSTATDVYEIYQRHYNRDPLPLEITDWQTFESAGFTHEELEHSIIGNYEHLQSFRKQYEIVLDLSGFKLNVLRNDLAVGTNIIKNKVWEPHLTRAIEAVLKPGDTFLDVGANIGYYAMLAASLVGPTGKVIAVEPNLLNIEQILKSIAVNQFKNVTVYPLAATEVERLLAFHVQFSNGGVSENEAVGIGEQWVQGVLLDNLLRHEKQIHVLKIDVEAHESAALKGMEALLKRHRPILFTEFHPYLLRLIHHADPRDYLKQLIQYGYRLSIIDMASQNKIEAPSVDFIMSYWESLNQETIHLDLQCDPVGAYPWTKRTKI